MTFAAALEVLLAGGKVRRSGWGNESCVIHVDPSDLADGFCKYDVIDQLIDSAYPTTTEDMISTDWVEVKG